jgi:hypothetical protein
VTVAQLNEAGFSCLSGQTSVPDFLRPAPGSRALPPLLLDTGDGDSNYPQAIQEEVFPA